MSKLAIVLVAASAFMLAPGAAGAASGSGEPVAAGSKRPAAGIDLSAQSRRTRRSPPRRAPVAQPSSQNLPAGMRMGYDPDPRIQFELNRSRGSHGD